MGGGGRPQTQGVARVLSWAVAVCTAEAISAASAKVCPANAARRSNRHQPSAIFSQQAERGMNTCRIRRWRASHPRTATLVWLDRLSVTMRICPRGFARATCPSSPIQPSLLRAGAQQVTSVPSRTRSAP